MQKLPIIFVVVHLLNIACPATATLSASASPAITTLETVRTAREVMMNDPAAALKLGVALERRAMGLPQETERRLMLARAKWIQGEANLRLKHVGEARRLIEASYALSVALRDPQAEGDSLLSRGSIKELSGDPAGALQDYLEANQWFQRTADARSQAITLQYLSQLYADAQDLKRAELYLRQSAETFRGEPMIQLALANNMGNLLAEQGQYSKAETEFRRGLSIARHLGVHALQLQLLSNLTLAQISQEQLAKASRTANEMTQVARRTGTMLTENMRATAARVAFARGRIQVARQIMMTILVPANGKPQVFDRELHNSAYEIFKAAGDTQLALRNLEIANRLRDQAMTLAISNKAALMAARFDFDTQALRIAALKAAVRERDISIERKAISQERMIFVAVGLMVLIFVALLSVWLNALRRSRDRFRAVSVRLEQSNTALEAAFQEVGERAHAEKEAMQLARHDALTGLPNRRQLSELFEAGVERCTNVNNAIFIMLLDLDRFKLINDLHGHEVGDAVLVAIAERLDALCRLSDAKVVRLGGDEFLVMMSAGHGDEGAKHLADAIIHEIALPIYVGERRLMLGASIGISSYPLDGTTIEELLRCADNAMYEAKRLGNDRFCFFESTMAVRERLRIV